MALAFDSRIKEGASQHVAVQARERCCRAGRRDWTWNHIPPQKLPQSDGEPSLPPESLFWTAA